MKSTNTMGLSILAGGLAFVGSANAATDLIVNGSFEEGPGIGWVGAFGTYNYSAAYFAGPAVPESENPGANYSWRHGVGDNDFSGPLTQQVGLVPALTEAEIDAGRGTYTFSAWMASYTENPDRPYVTVQFFDASGTTPIGSAAALDRASGLNFVTFADGVTVFDQGTHEHNWAKYSRTGAVPPGARSARVGVTHSPNAEVSGRPDSYTDLVKLEVEAVAFVAPSLDSAQPSGLNVRPDALINISLVDGSVQVDTNSIQLTFDGLAVAPAITKAGPNTTIQYDPPGLIVPASSHNYRLIFQDNGVVPVSQTNDFNFTVSSYYHILLPAPLHFENFDSTAEGDLPAGWMGLSYSDLPDPTCDPLALDIGGLQDLNSACHGKWTTIDSARFNNAMLTYGGHTPETDYRRVLTPNYLNVVNGAVLENLAHNNIAFGNSGYRDGISQVMYLSSPDFDLTGQNNVYLAFHSIWEQNQDSIGAVEYSIDEGVTWLPVVYYLHDADVVRDGEGNVDAKATFEAPQTDIASYTDPVEGLKGGHYGAFLGVVSNQWSTLAPFISPRPDDNPADGKRVEVFRLPAADNQSKVRLRFAHAGADSWYFGLDNVGLYQITSVAPPLVTVSPTNVVEHVGNTVVFSSSPFGIGPFTYQWQHNGIFIAGQTGSILSTSAVHQSVSGVYTVRVGYPGGFTNASATLTLLDPSSALVTGHWDFEFYNMAATIGFDLEFADDNSANNTFFTDSDFEGIPGIDGENVTLMAFPGADFGRMSGYIMRHGINANGGGAKVNQYTLIMDVLYPVGSHNADRAILQTNPGNTDNRDIAIGANNGIGVSEGFQGSFAANAWQRIAFALDLAGPGPNPIMAKYINGVKVGQQELSEGLDGRWSLVPANDPNASWALLFADDTAEARPGYVSSIQIRNGRLSDAQIARLGGPSRKIPGAIRLSTDGGQLTIHWSGGVPLQSAENVTGPWNDVIGATSPYPVPAPLGPRKFYRPKL